MKRPNKLDDQQRQHRMLICAKESEIWVTYNPYCGGFFISAFSSLHDFAFKLSCFIALVTNSW